MFEASCLSSLLFTANFIPGIYQYEKTSIVRAVLPTTGWPFLSS